MATGVIGADLMGWTAPAVQERFRAVMSTDRVHPMCSAVRAAPSLAAGPDEVHGSSP